MKIGFIGCGNMGGAILKAAVKHGGFAPEDIVIYDLNREAMAAQVAENGVRPADSETEVAQQADIILLAIKPQFYGVVIDKIRSVCKTQVILSIAAGKTLQWLEEAFGQKLPLVRAMPNTPAMVGEGITAITPNDAVSQEQLAQVQRLFEACGQCQAVPERLMEAVVAVSGSAPAYLFILMEAMADAAVLEGMPRSQAYIFAAQAVLGSAKMVLETGRHPAELKDMVCSPAGTTIEAVKVLEKEGFRSAVMQAMHATAEKARNL